MRWCGTWRGAPCRPQSARSSEVSPVPGLAAQGCLAPPPASGSCMGTGQSACLPMGVSLWVGLGPQGPDVCTVEARLPDARAHCSHPPKSCPQRLLSELLQPCPGPAAPSPGACHPLLGLPPNPAVEPPSWGATTLPLPISHTLGTGSAALGFRGRAGQGSRWSQ